MKGPKTTSIAHKKLADPSTKKEKASKKNSDAPKRPASAFFVFMDDFRKTYKENFPDNKSVSAVGKAGGEKWKEMSESRMQEGLELSAWECIQYIVCFAPGEECLTKAYEKVTVLIHSSLLTVSTGNLHCDDNSDSSISLACQSYTSFDAV
ncbi:high mobility group B4 [Actinidia rufa]|uniref:High mobility group B4 n=1 Tax=Actinidia rufa TaxID=165716 RepID=A0A7J0FFV7_9ERIC|nr:high mobility group B4 [Actinidia rufa]